ncbi:hypothetical protein BU25DRAFT_406336 [Macroventuria anomochaeta]|uniref:Uncharacterized protein n=1 Tax=Macroventuria anomochaeta TaxID=301207 RepID=A0ACB6SFI4_9PLEO|nr:uncharacterized protein BU25DRAFT_406336 [Macroventuria anomochaeta]KAF2633081.1 hypothetical protein BU25DRAFT_406336 [Macroventuria anomochaeta]
MTPIGRPLNRASRTLHHLNGCSLVRLCCCERGEAAHVAVSKTEDFVPRFLNHKISVEETSPLRSFRASCLDRNAEAKPSGVEAQGRAYGGPRTHPSNICEDTAALQQLNEASQYSPSTLLLSVVGQTLSCKVTKIYFHL